MSTLNFKRGFSMIEILVVVAIIGLLATVVLGNMGSARAKSRDARRLSDLKQIANVIAIADANVATTFATCTTAGTRLATCTAPSGLGAFSDPTASASTLCPITSGASASAPCEYTVAITGATTQSWKVCTYLETKAGPITTNGGLVNIDQKAIIKAGCN